ncbi:MAG: methionyl-tRNA formyltransferase [Acidobacteria bacterium]|nr:MAG: methionyl-tRNA formyltransferase [Acidobacteriota bacterium]PYY18222.1 MAG: methionyl-tRNA formyltransferase [Acidobacteriota bacterium]
MKLVFCGTPQFAVPTLEALLASGHEIPLVVTQPDRPQGRGLELATSPVKHTAQRHSLRIEQPEKIKSNADFRVLLEKIQPDAIIVVGYGRIVPPWMLALPKHGNINLHGSLLPKYRGAAPIQWAIAEGEKVSGVTSMLLNEGLDTGDILLQRELAIAPDDTAIGYGQRLAAVGAELMVETLRQLADGTIKPQPQDHSRASLAPILKKEDAQADFESPAQRIYNRLRGFQPWPGCYAVLKGKKLGITSAKVHSYSGTQPKGEMLVDRDQLFVICGENSVLQLLEVQPEGKRRMAAADFIRGYRPQSGEKLGA